MRALSITVPRSALLLSSSGDSETTLTVSVRLTPSCALMFAVSPTDSRMSVRVYFWNPVISTVMV